MGTSQVSIYLRFGLVSVRELVARRIPLYRFVLANVVNRYDLDRADGRIDALREAAKLVTSIRDRSKVDAFARELARPMPRPPSRSATFGTRFHQWVEARFGQQDLLDPEDLPGQADRGIDDDADRT